ncbi:MAG TPA: hypothetical protein VJ046_00190 [Candidatus Paceibacterota bacterium]|nr:hypothetical protein [Candidatus Paceibacterota bacterium]
MSGAESGYRRYLELGGIINETDYQSAIDRMNRALDGRGPQVRSSEMLSRVGQAEGIAQYSGIALNDSGERPDPRIVLYVILRGDTRPEGVKYHHDQMSDQRIFGEVLRMLGDTDSFDKLVKAHPHISFKYEREEQ